MLHGGAKQRIGMLALALKPNIMVNSIDMSWQRVCLPQKSYIIDVDDQAVAWRRCRVILETVLPSHADDGATESCWRWHCWCNLVTTRCRCRVILAMVLPSHAGNGAVGATWPWHDVDAESCWRQCYRIMLATVLPGQFGRDALYMSSHASDSAIE
jgi:hypothetical protein